MVLLPPAETPLNQHSLIALDSWLEQLGAKRNNQDLASSKLSSPQWIAEIHMKQDELTVTWDQEGRKTSCSFPYGLTRTDVEMAMDQGP